MRKVALASAFLLLGAAVLALFAFQSVRPRTLIVWELPAGYRGWILVEYEDPACPALTAAGAIVISVDESGRACTSHRSLHDRWRTQEYVYVLSDGTRRPINAPPDSDVAARAEAYAPTTKKGVVFIGTAAELEMAWDERPRTDR